MRRSVHACVSLICTLALKQRAGPLCDMAWTWAPPVVARSNFRIAPSSLFIDRPARVCALQTLVRDWEGRFMLSTPLIYNICSPDPSEGHPFLFLTPTGLLLDGDDAFVVLKLCFFYSFPRLLLATYLLFRRSSSGRRDRTCT
jgi:hypothetical protein